MGRLRPLPMLPLLGVVACEVMRPLPVQPPPRDAPPAISATAALELASSDCELGARPLSASVPAHSGGGPSVWLTRDRGELRVWYPSGYQQPFRTASVARNGSLSNAELVDPFGALGEAEYPALMAFGDTTVAVAEVYRTRRDADVFLALRRGGRWNKPLALIPDPDLDTDPVVAIDAERIAVAWRHGVYPSAPDISLAILDRGGRLLHAAIVERDARAEGIALASVPNGWLLVYAPSDPPQHRGLVALSLGPDGAVRARNVVFDGDAIWPIAAWNGRELGVAFRNVRSVGFLRLDAQGKLLEPNAVRADQHPDPLAGFHPLSLLADERGYWLADVASFVAPPIIARRSQARVVRLDQDGRGRSFAIVSESASVIRIATDAGRIRGVFADDGSDALLHVFELACRKPAPVAPSNACDAREEPLTGDRFAGLRAALVRSAAPLDGDLVLGLARLVPAGAPADAAVARVRRDGTSAWTTNLGQAYEPAVASGSGTIAAAIKTGSGDPEELVLLDAADGRVRARRKLAARADAHCVVATPGGWLVARSSWHPGESSMRVLLDAKGRTIAESRLDEPFAECALLAVPRGFLLAFTHTGDTTETSWLFVRELDPNGVPRAKARRVPGLDFARVAHFGRYRDKIVLLFTDALERGLSALELDEQGTPRSHVAEIAQTYGVRGYALWQDEAVWSSKQALGRRGCLEQLLAR